MQKLRGGGATEYGGIRCRIQPRPEAGDPACAWLNGVVAVTQGKVAPQRVDSRVDQLR